VSKKILIADDHKILREGLRSLLESKLGHEIVAEAEDGITAIELAIKLVPDVIIMDITMPELSGIEATRRITAKIERAKIIALSMHADKRFVLEMISAGASGYLLKDCAFEEVAIAIETVLNDRLYVSPGIQNFNLIEFESQFNQSPLTIREREVLRFVAEGKSTKEIADELYTSIRTIEKHRGNIMEKLEIYSVAELTKYALREGITTLET
jgi:DNA-binding NarL/FixJ family response regulator